MQGRPVVNSISLKEGEAEFLRQARLARRYGAAVISMAFDEQGQADTVERKLDIGKRVYRLLTEEAGFDPRGHHPRPQHLRRRHGHRGARRLCESPTSRRCARIKDELPDVQVSGGVSNVSFSFRGNDPLREAIHAVFLYYGIKAGMDMGIVNAGALPVYDEINPELRDLIEDLLLNRRADATERLLAYAEIDGPGGADDGRARPRLARRAGPGAAEARSDRGRRRLDRRRHGRGAPAGGHRST